MRTAYLSHPAFLRHDPGADHPECPARLSAIEDNLIVARLMDLLHYYEAPFATREQLLRVHSEAHIKRLESIVPLSGRVMLDLDTAMSPGSLEAAFRAAGAVVHAVDLLMEKTAENAFCAVRPPGHHALRDRAMGFCLFNNVAVGVAHALEFHRCERVAIVDFDVHHGNGTEAIFCNDPRVLLCSSFQHPWYPHTDLAACAANTIYAPLPAGSNGEAFRCAVSEHVLPALETFRPEFIFLSAGFDAHRDEELAQLNLTETDYAWITSEVLAVADRHADGRVVSVLEGGYALDALGRSVAAHVKVLLGA